MTRVFTHQGKARRSNRKEILFTADEIELLKFASLYYSVDVTTAARILIRTAMIELIAKQRRDGTPQLSGKLQQIINELGF